MELSVTVSDCLGMVLHLRGGPMDGTDVFVPTSNVPPYYDMYEEQPPTRTFSDGSDYDTTVYSPSAGLSGVYHRYLPILGPPGFIDYRHNGQESTTLQYVTFDYYGELNHEESLRDVWRHLRDDL